MWVVSVSGLDTLSICLTSTANRYWRQAKLGDLHVIYIWVVMIDTVWVSVFWSVIFYNLVLALHRSHIRLHSDRSLPYVGRGMIYWWDNEIQEVQLEERFYVFKAYYNSILVSTIFYSQTTSFLVVRGSGRKKIILHILYLNLWS